MNKFQIQDSSWQVVITCEKDCPAETKKKLYEMVELAMNMLSTLNTEKASSGQSDPANSGNAM